MAIEALIVDLDGTVWDSRPWYAQIIAEAADLRPTDIVRELGRVPLPTLIDRTPGITRASFGRQIATSVDRLAIYPTVRESLEVLASRGSALVVATSLPAWIAGPLLDESGLRPLFRSVADASSGYRKPDPRLLGMALPDVSLHPESVLVVGDDQRDAELSRRAGVGFAWAAYGYGSEPDLPKYVQIDCFDELLNL